MKQLRGVCIGAGIPESDGYVYFTTYREKGLVLRLRRKSQSSNLRSEIGREDYGCSHMVWHRLSYAHVQLALNLQF